MELLTNSRMSCARTCLRKHAIRYEYALRPEADTVHLKIGSAFHAAMECEFTGGDAIAAVQGFGLDPYDEETVMRLVMGHRWRWQNEPLEIVAAEVPFDLPIRNPETGAETPIWRRAGKIDAIARLPDGRLALVERKTTSEDLDPGSDYWTRIRIDQQSVGYFTAARAVGYDVQTVVYDVVRKPSIRPCQVPLVDDDGMKIVLDASGERVRTKDGKKWRESASTAEGYSLQTRDMTREEWGDRLNDDIASRPDYYFARVEIPRLEQDLALFEDELWQQQLSLRAAQRSGHWFRNPSSCKTFYGACEFLGVCERNDLETHTPEGFVRLSNVHPELGSPEASPAQLAR